MAKVKVDAKEALDDIRAGTSDAALLDKYRLSAMGLQSLFNKLVDAGLISRAELDMRIPLSQKSVDIAIFRCPACDMPQFMEFDECPQCGIIISKFKKKRARASAKASGRGSRGASPIAGAGDERGAVMFRANLRRTGSYDTRGVAKLTQLKWKFKAGGWVSSSPAVLQDRVLFGSLDGNFYSVNKETAQERWHFKTGSSIYSSCAIAGAVVFFGSLDGAAYGLDIQSGEPKFKFVTAGPVYSSPAVADGRIYFGSLDGHLHAVDVVRQTERWKFKTGGPVYSTPAISEGNVYFGSLDGNLYAVAGRSGKRSLEA